MLCYVMLCYAMFFYDMLCYVMLWYGMLCYVLPWYVMLCYAMVCYVMLCYDGMFLGSCVGHELKYYMWERTPFWIFGIMNSNYVQEILSIVFS